MVPTAPVPPSARGEGVRPIITALSQSCTPPPERSSASLATPLLLTPGIRNSHLCPRRQSSTA